MRDDELIELGEVSGNRGCLPLVWVLLGVFVALVAAGVWWAVR
jgi:hypothetical protein